jgi:diguanylate cyclase (GGDEF)-like protein/PAS domain S-box-containing protein
LAPQELDADGVLSRLVVGRLAAILYVLCALAILASLALPNPPAMDGAGILSVCAAAIAIGVLVWHLPWTRWRRSTSLWFAVLAFVLIALLNRFSGDDTDRYGIFFLVAFMWVGLGHPRGTSLRLVPLLVIAYVLPMRADGTLTPVAVSAATLFTLVCVLVSEVLASIVYALQRMQGNVQARETYFRALSEHASDLVVVLDAEGIIRYASPSHQAVLGYAPEALLGRSAFTLIAPEDTPRLHAIFAATVATTGAIERTECLAQHADGSWRALELVGKNRLDDPAVRGLIVNGRDITEGKAFEEQLRHQAFHDPLTTLPNRALFMARLEHDLALHGRHAGSVAVLFLDLDRFKVVNDSLGHEAGDRLLVSVAERLAACARQDDTVARLGGDEFAVLLSDLSEPERATQIAERMIAALNTPVRLGSHEVVTATSVGIVTSTPQHTAIDMLRDADVALYRAKMRGRGRYEVFDEAMNARALERLDMESALRRALERGELEVHYQPKVELATGRFSGMEALVRWRHPQRGLLAPTHFIPLAEETGLIRPLGQWVLEEACRQTRIWREETPDATIVTSVNLSASEFQQSTLCEDVACALRSSGVDPRCIQLEITESVAMENAESAVATLHRLRALGVQLAIDDFGTGYSSLAYLKRFPVDALKIDRTFITGLMQASEDASIVDAVVSLAHALNLLVVAEGVETAEIAARLAALGCELGQGYYFAKPLPRDQAAAFIHQSHLVVSESR